MSGDLAYIGSLLIRTLPLAQAETQIPVDAHLCIRTSNRITYAEGVSTTNRHQPNRRIETLKKSTGKTLGYFDWNFNFHEGAPPVARKPEHKQQRRSPLVRAMIAAGFAVEKHGAWWEVWSNELMQGTTDEYRTLREVAANSDYYLELAANADEAVSARIRARLDRRTAAK